MMLYKVHMLAFPAQPPAPIQIRHVEVEKPSANIGELVEQIFYFGQNDFQLIPNCNSVSMGDVIEVDKDNLYLVLGVGTLKITQEEFEKWSKVSLSFAFTERSFRKLISCVPS